jgi:hypothetical protein
VSSKYTGFQANTPGVKQIHRVSKKYTGCQTNTPGVKQIHRVSNKFPSLSLYLVDVV